MIRLAFNCSKSTGTRELDTIKNDMRDFIRSGKAGRCALALVLGIWGGACLAQETAGQSTAEATKTTPPTGVDTAKPADAEKAPEKAPAAAPAGTPAVAQSAAAPSSKEAAPGSKEKSSSSKKGRGQKNTGSGAGIPVFTGVESKPYEIGPEDVLFLNVLHQQDVTGMLTVRPDGFVSVRFAGEILAAGLTSEQLSDQIADKLTKYFNHPEVNIQVMKILSKKYYVSGEVHRQGAFPLSTPKTVLEAIIEAGGPAEFAKSNKIYILRGKEKIMFNFKDVSKGRNLQQNILVQNGDVIVIP
jgi:polysaccharide export outer membrane protein